MIPKISLLDLSIFSCLVIASVMELSFNLLWQISNFSITLCKKQIKTFTSRLYLKSWNVITTRILDKFRKLSLDRNGIRSGVKPMFLHFFWHILCKLALTSKILYFKFMEDNFSNNIRIKWIRYSSKWNLLNHLLKNRKTLFISQLLLIWVNITETMVGALMVNA